MGVEAVHLNGATLRLYEWIPMDPNLFDGMAMGLEAAIREKGFLLADEVDETPKKSLFKSINSYARVCIEEYVPNEVLTLLMKLEYENSPGEKEKQREILTVRIPSNGIVEYSAYLDEERVSLDKLAYVLDDLYEDTSRGILSIALFPQKRVLRTIYEKIREEGYERRKYALVLANSMEVSGDNMEVRAELTQIVGNLIKESDKYYLGETGAIVVGEPPEWLDYYARMRAISLFMEDYINFLLITGDKLIHIRDSLKKGRVSFRQARSDLMEIQAKIAPIKIVNRMLELSVERLGNSPPELRKEREFLYERLEAIDSLLNSLEYELDGLISLVNTYIDENLGQLNRITTILSTLFGALGIGEVVSDVMVMLGYSNFLGAAVTVLSMLVTGALVNWFIGRRSV